MDEEVDAALMAAGHKMQQMQAEIERLRGIVPDVLERLNDELCAENERLRAELAEAVTALPQAVRSERERCALAALSWGDTHDPAETVNARNASRKIAYAIQGPNAKLNGGPPGPSV